MKIWISKYALTNGITEHECDPPRKGENIVYPGDPYMSFVGFVLGKEAHTSREEAVEAAQAQRKKKIASVRKQLQRLEGMTF